jgi:ABC-type phosphate/phosphonate transport system substrate-binding protein
LKLGGGLLMLVFLMFTLVACGGNTASDTAQPSGDQIEHCLKLAGAEVEPLASQSEGELIGAQASDGEVILIFNLSNSDMTKEALPVLEEALRGKSGAGEIKTAFANNGTTLIGVVGNAKVDNGAVSPKTEALAKRCGTRDRASKLPV